MTAIGNHNEIVDRIIGHVREVSDGHFRTPLKSCALVSKAWLPQSQRYLFHHISLQFGTELKRWCRNITKERAQVLSKYVRWLSYSPPYKTKDANALERFAYFTHLETLCIFKVDFGKFSDDKDEFQSVFGHFGNSPRYLVIDRCLGHFPTIINLFRLLPNLTHLDIFHTTLPYTCLLTDSDMSGDFGKIETLRMTGTERYFINALMPARFTGLKNISYFDKGPESAGDLRVFLNNCKTLETLTVLSSHNLNHPHHDRGGRPEDYSLEPCRNLREIAFDNIHANKPNPEIVAVLPTIDSPHFTTVTFLAQNANVDFDPPSSKYWKRIDEVLAVLGENLMEKYERGLNVVFDGWSAPVEDDDATERWMNLLPNFAQVGEITFKRMDPPPYAHDPPTWRSLTRDVMKEE